MTSLLNLDDVEQFTHAVGPNLNSEQAAHLQELLYHHPESGRWLWNTWTVQHPSPGLIAARALVGLLVLDEDIIWSIPQWLILADTFRRLEGNVIQLGGSNVKVRRASGEQGFERLDTGTRMRFISPRNPDAMRGYSCDLLIVEGSAGLTDRQRDDLLPTMVTRPNPQIVYA